MKLCFLLMAALSVRAQQPVATHDNYYSPNRDAQVGERLATQLQTNVVAAPEPRLERIGSRLAVPNQQFRYRFFVFDGGKPSFDTAPAAAFPADWRRLNIDEAIAIAGGAIFLSRRLLSRDDEQLTAILAHAIGHIELRHQTVGMTRGELAQVEVQFASRSMPDEAVAHVRAVRLNRYTFNRACETAADSYAARLLHEAGLDPATLLTYLRTLPSSQDNELSVYPPPAERVKTAQLIVSGFAQ